MNEIIVSEQQGGEIVSLENIDIRMDIRKSGVTQYKVAKAMGVSESWFSRLLREPVTVERREQIYEAIRKAQGRT